MLSFFSYIIQPVKILGERVAQNFFAKMQTLVFPEINQGRSFIT